MKKIQFLLLALFSLAIISCQNDNELPSEQTIEEQKDLIIDEALQSAVLDDLLQDIDTYSLMGEGLKSAETGGCPALTIQRPGSKPTWPRTIKLNFGDGCEKNGKMKSGIMKIKKSGPWYESGSKRTVTFENYKVDGMSIDGEKVIENITDVGGEPTFLIIAKLDMAWVKNDTLNITVHREINKTQKWTLGFRDKEIKGQVVLNGESKIVKTVNDEEKTIEKTYSDISIVFGCRFPQAGATDFKVKTFDKKNLKFTMDYGTTGEASEKCQKHCDCMATLIIAGTDSEDIDLSARWWKQATEKNKKE